MTTVEAFRVKMAARVKTERRHIGRFCYDMSVEAVGFKCGSSQNG